MTLDAFLITIKWRSSYVPFTSKVRLVCHVTSHNNDFVCKIIENCIDVFRSCEFDLTKRRLIKTINKLTNV